MQHALRVLVFGCLLPFYSYAHGGGDCHDHCQTEVIESLQTRIVHMLEQEARGEISREDAVALKEGLSTLIVQTLAEVEKQAENDRGLQPYVHGMKDWAVHTLSHLNPFSVWRMLKRLVLIYGPSLGVAAGVGELSEWLAYAVGAANINNWVGWTAIVYANAHVGDAIAVSVFLGLPYIVTKAIWATTVLRHFGKLSRYHEHVKSLRNELPVDWSLNPYIDESGFIVLDDGGWFRRIAGRLWRKSPQGLRELFSLRKTEQEKSYPTLYLDDLIRAAHRAGVAIPRSNQPFESTMPQESKTLSIVEALKRSPAGRAELERLLVLARARVVRAPNQAAELSLGAQAEQVVFAIEQLIRRVRVLESQVHFKLQSQLLARARRELPALANELMRPAVESGSLNRIRRLTNQWIAVFDGESEAEIPAVSADAYLWRALEWKAWVALHHLEPGESRQRLRQALEAFSPIRAGYDDPENGHWYWHRFAAAAPRFAAVLAELGLAREPGSTACENAFQIIMMPQSCGHGCNHAH